MVFLKDSDWPTDGVPSVGHMPIGQHLENDRTEAKQSRRWPIAAMTATYRYLSEGVRTLGKSYSVYDDQSSR
jgi:hypothetical protein